MRVDGSGLVSGVLEPLPMNDTGPLLTPPPEAACSQARRLAAEK